MADLTFETTYNEIVEYGIIGRRLARRVVGTGFRNTAGEPEVYAVSFDGTFNNGSVRANVFVQRKNGKFAILNSNVHTQTIGRVLACFKQQGVTAEYLRDNAAI